MKLSSGRNIDANSGVIGINEDGEVFSGYDERVLGIDRPEWAGDDEAPFSAAERAELADLMIARWQAFKIRSA